MKYLYGVYDVVGNRVVNYFSANSDIIALRMNATDDEKVLTRYRGFNLIKLASLDEAGKIVDVLDDVVCRMVDCEVKLSELLESEGL